MKWIKASESMSPPIGKVLVRFTDTGQKHLLNITSLIDFKVEVDIRGYCFKKDEVEWLDESTPDGWVSVEEMDEMTALKDYWYNRCFQAEKFIEVSPVDPDITPEQIEAYRLYRLWQESKKDVPQPPKQ